MAGSSLLIKCALCATCPLSSVPLPDSPSAKTLEEGGSICGLISCHVHAAAQVPAAPCLEELDPRDWLARWPPPPPPADTHFGSCSLAVGLLTPRFCWPLLAKEPRYCLRCDSLGSSEAPAWPSCPSQHRAWGDVGTGLRCNPPAPLTPHRAPSQTSSLCAKHLHGRMGPRLALQQ